MEGTEMAEALLESAKVTSKGQVTIPSDVRKQLGIPSGGKIVFVSDGKTVIVANAAVYAMETLQKQMEGAAREWGVETEDDVAALVREIRAEV